MNLILMLYAMTLIVIGIYNLIAEHYALSAGASIITGIMFAIISWRMK